MTTHTQNTQESTSTFDKFKQGVGEVGNSLVAGAVMGVTIGVILLPLTFTARLITNALDNE